MFTPKTIYEIVDEVFMEFILELELFLEVCGIYHNGPNMSLGIKLGWMGEQTMHPTILTTNKF